VLLKIFLSFTRFAAHNFYNRNHSIFLKNIFFLHSLISSSQALRMILRYAWFCTLLFAQHILKPSKPRLSWILIRGFTTEKCLKCLKTFFIIFFTYGMCLAPNTHTFQQHFHTFHSYTWIFIYLHPITTSVTLW